MSPHVHLELQEVTLFGNKAILTNISSQKSTDEINLDLRWALNLITGVFVGREKTQGQRSEGHTELRQ